MGHVDQFTDRTMSAGGRGDQGHFEPAVAQVRGFTLIELSLCLAILGVVAAVAAPRYASAISRRRVDVAARRIVADLAMAQSRAKATSASRSVRFDPVSATYRLDGVTDLDHPLQTYEVDLSREPYVVTLDLSALGSSTLTFNGYGVPSRGGSVAVRAGGESKVVRLNPGTGLASIE